MNQGQNFAMHLLPAFRIISLCVSFVLAVIVMSLSSHFTSFTISIEAKTVASSLLAIVTAGLAILTLPVMLIVDLFCKRAFTSMVLVELVWLSFLWLLWLITGVDAADSTSHSFPNGCEGFVNGALGIACRDSVGIVVVSFLNFMLLLAYSITLLVCATVNSNRGRSVWTSSVEHASLPAPNMKVSTSLDTLANGGRNFHSRIPSCV